MLNNHNLCLAETQRLCKGISQAFDPHQDIKTTHTFTLTASWLAGESEREKGRNRESRNAKRNEGSKHAKNVQKQQTGKSKESRVNDVRKNRKGKGKENLRQVLLL